MLLCPSPPSVEEDNIGQPRELFAAPKYTVCRGSFHLFTFPCDRCLLKLIPTLSGAGGHKAPMFWMHFWLIAGWPLPHLLPKDESQCSAACPAGAGSKLRAFVFFHLALCSSCEALGINKPQPGFAQPTAVAQGENERFVFLSPRSRADGWLN